MKNNWQVRKLGEEGIAKVMYGKANPNSVGEIPVIGSSGVYAYTKTPLVTKPTIIVGRKGTAGVAYYSENPCWPSDTAFYLDINFDLFDPKFLYLFITHKKLDGQHSKTTLPSLKRQDLEDLLVPLLELNEQKKVIHVLDTIQEVIKIQNELIEKTKELKAALMQKLFAEGETKKLSEIAKIERGKFAHRPRNDPEFYGGDIPFIQTADVTNSNGHIKTYSQTLNEKGLSVSRIFPKGTVVITIAANIGYTGILDFDSAFPDSLIGITPYEGVDKKYLNYYLSTQQTEMDRLASRGTQKNINIEFLTPWPVKLPSLKEQQRIVDILLTIDEKIELEQRKKDLYQELFESMLDKLMLGEIRVDKVNFN